VVGWLGRGGGPWEVAAGREMRDQKFISRGSAPLREFRWEQCRAPRQLGPNCWVPPKVGRRSEGGEDGAEKKVEEEAGRKGGGDGGWRTEQRARKKKGLWVCVRLKEEVDRQSYSSVWPQTRCSCDFDNFYNFAP
jgi:hypothetical protein